MDFIWVYVFKDSASQKIGIFDELEYSIRSVEKNYTGDYRLFVVGDEPHIPHEGVIHIPCPRVTEYKDKASNVTVDQYEKFRAAASSDLVGDEFVIMYDDIFILKPTSRDDLMINWARAEIESIDEYIKNPIRTGTISYLRIWRNTYEGVKMLRDFRGLKTYDWETHTPRYVQKDKFKDVLSKSDYRANPRLITAIYDGLYAENTQIITREIQSDMWAHSNSTDFDKEFSRHYMNIFDDIIVREFVDHMEKHFGKCS